MCFEINFLSISAHSTFGSHCGVIMDQVVFSEHSPAALCLWVWVQLYGPRLEISTQQGVSMWVLWSQHKYRFPLQIFLPIAPLLLGCATWSISDVLHDHSKVISGSVPLVFHLQGRANLGFFFFEIITIIGDLCWVLTTVITAIFLTSSFLCYQKFLIAVN